MAYTQLIPFDASKGGSVPNLCLDNVRRGYGISNKYGSAWEAWQHTQQHPDRNVPAGLAVPIYYSYTVDLGDGPQNYGHINVQLPDGRVWSDGNYYASIDAYMAHHSPKFVGWGESVNDFNVIGEDMATLIDDNLIDVLRIAHSEIGGWNFDDTHSGKNDALYLAAWKGKPLEDLIRTQWTNGGDFRTARIQEMGAYAGIVAANAELSKRPTQAQYDAAVAAGGGYTDADRAQATDTNNIVKQIFAKISSIFK